MADALDEGTPIVHLATHFLFRPGTIADSFLLLGDGNHLTLEEINYGDFKFNNIDQLTLSACDTAMGTDVGAGREVEGLGVLAQKKGAKSVLATLWSIADESTGIFMFRYYSLLQEKGMTKAEALRRVQVEFIEGKLLGAGSGNRRYEHPFYWAPFILMGNWL
jgi:CHAT domain-containing protein